MQTDINNPNIAFNWLGGAIQYKARCVSVLISLPRHPSSPDESACSKRGNDGEQLIAQSQLTILQEGLSRRRETSLCTAARTSWFDKPDIRGRIWAAVYAGSDGLLVLPQNEKCQESLTVSHAATAAKYRWNICFDSTVNTFVPQTNYCLKSLSAILCAKTAMCFGYAIFSNEEQLRIDIVNVARIEV